MILTIVLAASLMAKMLPIDEVRVSDGNLRLGDVAQLDAGNPQKVGSIVIARLPSGMSEIRLPRAKVEMLAKRAVPALQFSGAADGDVVIRLTAIASNKTAPCFEAARLLAAGEEVAIGDVAAVACDSGRMNAALRHNREAEATVAVRAINAGDYLGAAHFGLPAFVRRGDKLTLKSRAGPVVIERPVVAMQGAKPTDRRVFVQTADGAVFATDVAVERAK